MAASRRGGAAPLNRHPKPPSHWTVEDRLYAEGHAFDFFQAVRLLEQVSEDRAPVAYEGPPHAEVARFRAHQSMGFPASQIFEIEPPAFHLPSPAMTVTFMGLTGPKGELPQHYTELLLRLRRDEKGAAKFVLRDWFDLFNHRVISFFFRAWEKYRFEIAYERQARNPVRNRRRGEPFTAALFCLIGLGENALRNRLHIRARPATPEAEPNRPLAEIDDLALIHYSGLFSHRRATAIGLEAIVRDYFGVTTVIEQFRGQWLTLERGNQSRLGAASSTAGQDLIIGARVWDRQGKFRIRLGAMTYERFAEFLPDRSATKARKAIFLLVHLVRLYVGPHLEFEVQLILLAAEIPPLQLANREMGPRLGWNTWFPVARSSSRSDADEAVFDNVELIEAG
jgi:type VI secretion system protein ImpH